MLLNKSLGWSVGSRFAIKAAHGNPSVQARIRALADLNLSWYQTLDPQTFLIYHCQQPLHEKCNGMRGKVYHSGYYLERCCSGIC